MKRKQLPKPARWLILLLISSVILLVGIGIGIKLKNKKAIPNHQDSKEEQVKKLTKRIQELEQKQNQTQADKAEITRLKKELEKLRKSLPKPPPENGRFSALVPTKKEREYEKGENGVPLPISSVGCGTDCLDYFSYEPGHLVAGAALMTDTLDGAGNGSSILNDKGITHIIHVASLPYSRFNNSEEIFIDYVVKSVQNTIILADRQKFEKLAIPLVGGGTYLGSCDPSKLAERIIRGVINQLEKCQNLRNDIILVD
jgi:hypothetical protein